MAIQFPQGLQYPEEYLIEDDQNPMGDTNLHTNLIEYLKNVLKWLYRQENWLVFSNLNVHHPAIRNSKHYIVPDITLIKTTLPPRRRIAPGKLGCNPASSGSRV